MINIVKNKFIKKEKSDDIKISIALMSSFVVLTIQYFVLIVFDLFGTGTGSNIQLLSKLLVGIIYLYVLPVIFSRSKIKFITLYLISTLVFLINFLLFPENHEYIKDIVFPFFIMCLPSFIYTLSLRNWKIFKKVMKNASLVVFWFGTILGTLIFIGKASVGAYSMSLSYYMLLPTILFIEELFDNKFSFRKLLYVLVSLLIILALGSRGSMLCIGIFILLKLIKPSSKFHYKNIFLNLTITGMSILTFINLNNILTYLYDFLMNFGIKSRSINLFLADEVSLSGRDSIYEMLLREIINNPILGNGLGGDRRIIGWTYAHNFFLEILINFGVIIGSIILLVVIIFIIRLLLSNNQEKYSVVIIWGCLGFVSFMVSSSYLIDVKFWIFIGLLLNTRLFLKDENDNVFETSKLNTIKITT